MMNTKKFDLNTTVCDLHEPAPTSPWKMRWRGLVIAALTAGAFCGQSAADSVTPLYSFLRQLGDAGYPTSGVIKDAVGNLYGTNSGGVGGYVTRYGTVYQLAPPPKGQTKSVETIIHTFSGADGDSPEAALIMDKSGNLYGTTAYGGARSRGVAFELSPPAPGQTAWNYTLLHSFGGVGGRNPVGSLLMDGAGDLFGTTESGGGSYIGVVFQLKPPPPGETVWRHRVLYTFTDGATGCPRAGLIAGANGVLFGTAYGCGYPATGAVFQLSPGTEASSPYTLHNILTFTQDSSLGTAPAGNLIMDAGGALYGTTAGNPDYSRIGTVFKLSPPAPGSTSWTPLLLHAFNLGSDGYYPQAGLLMDASGNLFGTTEYGPIGSGAGTVFKLAPPAHGGSVWNETIVPLNRKSGANPLSTLIFDEAGSKLVGTCLYGGRHNFGTVFSLKP